MEKVKVQFMFLFTTPIMSCEGGNTEHVFHKRFDKPVLKAYQIRRYIERMADVLNIGDMSDVYIIHADNFIVPERGSGIELDPDWGEFVPSGATVRFEFDVPEEKIESLRTIFSMGTEYGIGPRRGEYGTFETFEFNEFGEYQKIPGVTVVDTNKNTTSTPTAKKESTFKIEFFTPFPDNFPRWNGKPFLFKSQIIGYLRYSFVEMSKIDNTLSNGLKARTTCSDFEAFIRDLDSYITIKDRNYLEIPEGNEMEQIQLPGERESHRRTCEACPPGTTVTFTVKCMPTNIPLVREWLSYGTKYGFGDRMNLGYGRFIAYELVGDDFKCIPEFDD